jgi:CheY-like chemotaxis protein
MNERASPDGTSAEVASTPAVDIEVLLVEDDPDDVMVMTRALYSSEFQVGLQVASNGQEALDLLRKKGKYADAATPNLVLLDLNMPVMSGQEFLEELRRDSFLHSVPVIVITTSDEPDIVREAYRFGANSVVTKATSIAGMTELMRLVTHYWFKTSRVFMVD